MAEQGAFKAAREVLEGAALPAAGPVEESGAGGGVLLHYRAA